jgi:class 3 adenylate cyclase
VAGLPTGTVTFLFTDLEGSTRLWEERRQAMRAALARHDEILRGAVEAQGGVVALARVDSENLKVLLTEARETRFPVDPSLPTRPPKNSPTPILPMLRVERPIPRT